MKIVIIRLTFTPSPIQRTHTFLPTSNHPSHICRNIPYSLAFRIRRNCSKEELCKQRFDKLKLRLVDRGYREKMVVNSIDKVKNLRRDDILEKVVQTDNNQNRVRAVFRYDRRLPDVSSILKRNWKTMGHCHQVPYLWLWMFQLCTHLFLTNKVLTAWGKH